MIKVLVIEDDPMVLKFHEHYLSQIEGVEIADKARTSDEAEELLDKNEYDLVLLDIFIPGIDGIELLKKIRKNTKNVDVIVVSAARDKERIQTALRCGVVDFIIKPFEFERLNSAIQNYLHRAELLNTNFSNPQEEVDQKELDERILYKKEEDISLTLPKGLDRNTLKTAYEKISEYDDLFTTEEIASAIGISRVSIRKYLDFLKSINALSLTLHRGAVGRPVYKYKLINRNEDIIKPYLEE